MEHKIKKIESHLPNFIAIPNPFKEPHHVYKPSNKNIIHIHEDPLIQDMDFLLSNIDQENSFSFMKDIAK